MLVTAELQKVSGVWGWNCRLKESAQIIRPLHCRILLFIVIIIYTVHFGDGVYCYYRIVILLHF